MGQTFDLGFSIDTSGLSRAGSEAVRAAENVAKLGDAERKLATDADKATEKTKEQAKATEEAGRKSKDYAEQTTTLTGKLRMQQQDVMNLVGAFRGQQGLVGGLDAASQSGARLFGGLGMGTLVVGALAVGIGVLAKQAWEGAKALAAAEDKAAMLEARLKSALGSTYAARAAMADLYEQTQQTGLGFQVAADAFARVARNNESIGLTQSQMLQMAETVQKLGAASGASQGEMSGAMVQFGQALASGRLQGDELRSIMENLPPLAKAIAENFEKADGTIGITIGTLRKMGSEGELTAGKIAAAVLRATEQARSEFDKLPTTMAQSTQRMEDAWEKMLATMGERLGASGIVQTLQNAATGFINGIKEALAEETIEEKISRLEKLKREGRAGAYRGPSNMMAGSAAIPANLDEGWTEADDAALAAAYVAKSKQDMEAALQAWNERVNKVVAPTIGLDAQTAEFAPMTEKVLQADRQVEALEAAIKSLNETIATEADKDNMVGEEYSVKNLEDIRDRLAGRLEAARQAAASIMSEYQKFAQAVSDGALARQLGGTAGGVSIVSASIQQQRGDRAKGVGQDLNSYIALGIRNALMAGNDDITNLDRKAGDIGAGRSLIGQNVSARLAQEVEQETAQARRNRFGDLEGKEIDEWARRYSEALARVKDATQGAAEAQRAFNAEQEAILSSRLANGALDPLSQRREQMEFQIEKLAKEYSDKGGVENPVYIREVAAIRSKDANDRLLDERMAARELEKQLYVMGEQNKLQRLSRDEMRVQQALMQKRIELEYAGVDASTERYRNELRLVELIERGKIDQEKNGDPGTRILNTFEDQMDKVGGLWKDTWKDIFTNGVDSAAEIFGKGMTDIILDISAQMIAEIAIRPFAEMARNMAMAFANWAVSSIFPGGGGITPQAEANFGSGWGTFRDGGIFSFAKGSPFTNKVFDTRQMFSFARGTKLGEMAEAGPEAVVPLDRGADGRLGINARGLGGGSETQVNIYDQRSGGEQVEVQEREGGDGRRVVDVIIRDAQRKNVRNGAMDRDMANTYGVKRQVTQK